MKAVKRGIAFLLSIIMMIGVSGCMINSEKDAAIFLKEKYNTEFLFVSTGDSTWSSKYRSYLFRDGEGNIAVVRKYSNNHIADNYASSIYDREIQSDLQELFDTHYKVFVDTSDEFKVDKPLDYREYIKSSSLIHIILCTTEIGKKEQIATTLATALPNGSLSLIIYEMNSKDFLKVDSLLQAKNTLTTTNTFNAFINNGTVDWKD